jgi:hypothetical protein
VRLSQAVSSKLNVGVRHLRPQLKELSSMDKIAVILLMGCCSAFGQIASGTGGTGYVTLTPGGWSNVTFDTVQKKMQMHKETVLGNLVLMPMMVEDDGFVVTVESKDEMFTDIIIEVFYRLKVAESKGDKPVSLLLHKTSVIPAVLKAKVMSDPFYVPWASVEFIRVKALKSIEQQEFK